MDKSVLIKWVKGLALLVYAFLFVITCAGVWNAASGEVLSKFQITCSVIYFILNAFLVGAVGVLWFKERI